MSRADRTGERTPLGVRSAQARSEATEEVEGGESNPAWRATKKDTLLGVFFRAVPHFTELQFYVDF